MSNDGSLREIIGEIYEAALDDTLWDPVLRRIADLTGSTGANLFFSDHEGRSMPIVGWVGMPEEGWDDLHEQYGTNDPRNSFALKNTDLLLQHDLTHTSEDDLKKNEYNSRLEELFGVYYYAGSLMLHTDRHFSAFTIQRSKAEGHVQRSEIEILKLLVPHLSRAVRMRSRIANLDLKTRAAYETIEQLPFGVAVLDDGANVIMVNRALNAMIERRDGVCLDGKHLSALDRADRTTLANLISSGTGIVHGGSLRLAGKSGGSMALRRSEGGRPYAVFVAPLLVEASVFATDRPAAIVFVTDPELDRPMPAEVLRHGYGLTQREAEFAVAMSTGKAIKEVAAELGIARGTARVHLERIFQKTNTHRQGELIRLLLRLHPFDPADHP